MRYKREDLGFERVATIDIETTHWKAERGETVAIGIALIDGSDAEVQYEPFYRSGPGDEGAVIAHAFEFLDECGADGLVSYNGRSFDMGFLTERLRRLDQSEKLPALNTRDTHIDLFEDRKHICEQTGQKWPKLEECLTTYGFNEPETVWNGTPLTNKRFGEELGPAYLRAVENGDSNRIAHLQEVIDHYLITDLEANLAIYYSDLGVRFEPTYLETREVFQTQS